MLWITQIENVSVTAEVTSEVHIQAQTTASNSSLSRHPALVNKLFAGTVACPFICRIQVICLEPAITELSSCNRDQLTCKAKHIYCLSLYRKGLPIPGLDKAGNGMPWRTAVDSL